MITSPIRPVHVVIVAYRQPEALRRCLAAVGGAMRITVIDNSSSAAVGEVAASAGAAYIDSGANLGFGAGINIALRRIIVGDPVDVLLLNPDALISAQGILQLAVTLHTAANHQLAALSPRLRGSDSLPQRVMWPFPTPGLAWLEALGAGGLSRWRRAPGFAIGAVLLLRWEAIQTVGFFDERFFLYAEETDWQRRAHHLGWQSGTAVAVTAEHEGGGSSNDERRRTALFHSGGETYQRKWHGSLGWQSYRIAVLVGCLVRLAHPSQETRQAAALRGVLYLKGPRRAAGLEC